MNSITVKKPSKYPKAMLNLYYYLIETISSL